MYTRGSGGDECYWEAPVVSNSCKGVAILVNGESFWDIQPHTFEDQSPLRRYYEDGRRMAST
eukprot:11142307-Alexandrium_andersonii.AAC.1